jgi:hypothetical protein
MIKGRDDAMAFSRKNGAGWESQARRISPHASAGPAIHHPSPPGSEAWARVNGERLQPWKTSFHRMLQPVLRSTILHRPEAKRGHGSIANGFSRGKHHFTACFSL